MSVIKLTITVDKLSNVMTLFDVIKVYRSTAGEGGPYSEITGVGTRITLVSGQSVYTYDDTTGDPTYYYKTSYYHETTTLESSLSDPIQGNADTIYVDVQSIRDEGVTTSQASDDRVLNLINVWQQFIEKTTRNWFVPREITWDFDGNGTTLTQFPAPIVSISALYINDDFTNAIDEDAYVVYSGRGGSERDDRKNPRIKLVTGETSIFTGVGQIRRRTTIFEIGESNQRAVGVFGYVESDGTTPKPIEYALKKLVVRSCRPLAGTGAFGFPAGPMIEEETDRHRRKWSDQFVASKVWSTTGDLEVDQILATYRAPIKVGAPRTTFRRFTGGQVLV